MGAPKLSREQVLAFEQIVKTPHLFEQLESVFVEAHTRAIREYEQAKEALVTREEARTSALHAKGRVHAYAEMLELFERQKI
jgi:hypothetical protein